MKKFLVVTFTVLYLLAMCRPVIPLVNYLVNQDYIAEFLCINQDKPEMQCNGKCQLMKELEKQDQEKRKNAPRIQLEDYPIGFVYILNVKMKLNEINTIKNFFFKNTYSYQYIYDFFHPPSPLV